MIVDSTCLYMLVLNIICIQIALCCSLKYYIFNSNVMTNIKLLCSNNFFFYMASFYENKKILSIDHCLIIIIIIYKFVRASVQSIN